MITSLIVVCRCGIEVDSRLSYGALCRNCQADDACEKHRDRLVELYRTWLRLKNDRCSTKSNEAQAARVRDRMEREVRNIEPDPSKAQDLINREARLSREAAGRAGLPVPGS